MATVKVNYVTKPVESVDVRLDEEEALLLAELLGRIAYSGPGAVLASIGAKLDTALGREDEINDDIVFIQEDSDTIRVEVSNG